MNDAPHPPLGGSPRGSPKATESTARAVRKMFSAVAPRYDFLNHFLSVGRDIAWRKATAKAVAPRSGACGFERSGPLLRHG